MFDLRHYIDLTVTAMEGASKDPLVDPYIPRFPAERRDKNTGQVKRVGDSGLSYGRLQNDVAANDRNVVTTFLSILAAHPAFAHDRILRQKAFARAARKGAISGDFDPSLLGLVGDALKSPEGKRLVNEQDERQIDRVKEDIKLVEKTLIGAGVPPAIFDLTNPDWIAVAYAAAWANREDNLEQFAEYISGKPVIWGNVQHKITGAPTLQDVIDYIGTQKQFRPNKPGIPGNGESFHNWQVRLVDAIKAVYVAHGRTLTAAEEAIIMTPRTSADPAAINPVGLPAPKSATPPSPPGRQTQSPQSPAAPAPTPPLPQSGPPPSGSIPPPSHSGPPSPFGPTLTPQSFPGGELEMDAGGRQASAADEPEIAPAASRPSPLRSILSRAKQRAGRALRGLTPASFSRGSTAGVAQSASGGQTGGTQASLPAVLPALDQGTTIDLGRADVDQIDAGQIADSADADHPLIAASFDTPTVPVGALANAAATRPGWPTSVSVGGRVFTREEVMAQTTISADGRRSTWTIPQPKPAIEPPLTEKRVRQLIREGINEWDSGFGVRYRSRHYIRRRRG